MTDGPEATTHTADWPWFEEVYRVSNTTDTAKGPRCEESPKHAHNQTLPLGCHGHPVGSATLARVPRKRQRWWSGEGRMADPHTRRSGAVFEDGLGASTTTPQQRQKLDLIKQFDGASLLSEG